MMKTKDNIQKSIALLSVLAGLLYTISLTFSLANAHKGGLEGTSTYWEKKLSENDIQYDTNESVRYKKVTLVADDEYLFRDSIYNKASNTYIPLHSSEIDVIAKENDKKSLTEVLLLIPHLLFGIFAIFSIFLIPILFYKLMISIYKGEIFTEVNIDRINKLGYIFLFIFGFMIFSAFYSIMEEKSMVNIENYHHQSIDLLKSTEILLFAVIILLIGKVMKKALLMKEEQDLTI